jgi:hypothetical protein
MADGFLESAKRQQKVWVREIRLLESGKETTFEIRGDTRVDTTLETLDDRRARLSELDALIAKHGAGDV